MSELPLYKRHLKRPDSGLGFQVQYLKAFQVVPSSLGSGLVRSAASRSFPPARFIPSHQSYMKCVSI